VVAIAVAAALPRGADPAGAAGPALSRVAVIVMENKERGEVIGNPAAPFVNRLADRYAEATGLYAVAHPSLPNYLALTAGSTFGIRSNCTSCAIGGTSVVDQLEAGGISWRAYMGGAPSACFGGAGHGRYLKRHNPFAYFRRVTGEPARCARVVPASRLHADLRGHSLPRFVWITPDACDDMHDCGVAAGDRYLARTVPALLPRLGPHGFLVVTWDEGSSARHGGGHIPTLVAGPDVRRGADVGGVLDHYSTLATIEEALGLRRLRNAAGARTLAAAFRGDAVPVLAGPRSDVDGDGLREAEERAWGSDPMDRDTDGDGLGDFIEVRRVHTDPRRPDTDRDGLGDADEVRVRGTGPLASDTDGDGMLDGQEVERVGTDPRRADSDADGADDGADAFPLDPSERVDTDGDGTGDAADRDDDDDGVLDARDAFRTDRSESRDRDRDGVGNRADRDDDGDAVDDWLDNCPLVPNPSQRDADRDGRGAACDRRDRPKAR
jgi:hypothetical protein